MTGGTNKRFFSRVMVVGLVALGFLGCTVVMGMGNKSLFADASYAAYASTGR